MSDHQKVLDRLRKLLALAASSNPHEAAAAMRQAQKLMQTYALSSSDVDMLEVKPHDCQFVSKCMPPAHIMSLANLVGAAFGTTLVLTGYRDAVRITYIGIGAQAEISAYVFDVLRRHMTRDRQDFLATLDKRLKRATKTRRADVFCRAWIARISSTVSAFQQSERDKQLLLQYVETKYGKSREYKPDVRKAQRRDVSAAMAGYQAAAGVALNQGVNGSKAPQQIGAQL